jgi:hypothetical protein
MPETPLSVTIRAACLQPGESRAFPFKAERPERRTIMKYRKTNENGKVVYRYNYTDDGGEVPVYKWGLDEFINHCIFPIGSFLDVMQEADEDSPAVEVLRRLYGAAISQLYEMSKVLDKDLGPIKIVTTNFVVANFMEETILGGEVDQEDKPETISAAA